MNLLPQLQALANPHRLAICKACLTAPHDVTQLCVITGLSQSATSQHLATLRAAGLVQFTRDGTRFLYTWRAVYPNGFFASIIGMHSND